MTKSGLFDVSAPDRLGRRAPRGRLLLVLALSGVVLCGCEAFGPTRASVIPPIPEALLETVIRENGGLCSKLGGDISQCTAPPRPKFVLEGDLLGVPAKDRPRHVICRLNPKARPGEPIWDCVPLYLALP